MLNYSVFLDRFFQNINKCNLDIHGLKLDHIAHQASSAKDYDLRKPEFLKISDGMSEELIGERRVSVFKLHEPIKYKEYVIPALELIEPKDNQFCDSEFQHAEFVVNIPFEEYIKKYPEIDWDTSSMNRDQFSHLKLNFKDGTTLKFLKQPILDLVSLKKVPTSSHPLRRTVV